MRAGALDRRITLRRAITGRDAANAPVLDWHNLATVWAAWAPLSDIERARAQQTAATATDRFRIRWSTDVEDLSPSDQLIFDGRLYAISAVRQLGRRVDLEITATALVDRPTK